MNVKDEEMMEIFVWRLVQAVDLVKGCGNEKRVMGESFDGDMGETEIFGDGVGWDSMAIFANDENLWEIFDMRKKMMLKWIFAWNVEAMMIFAMNAQEEEICLCI